ncbi:hypothetical protein ABB37_01532 [Leptomonas pyrrhocoris]|uniref:Uncharacterized protein n=1 Tax=Leptomonas pyrrhocoris TaxID=157538 RepID=A0A0N0DZC9_LEPPY|nr:hypothetical protein ABB37_01532 [Leptomonas pyrrhocoris]KPA85155.1 hypothetical protein ABB37_01532 [Leptomonas pyrrhocoris]|eukprot:XP_015663594.1 hypothetical protein ABB37_01532 [Leptomonas pyrrhocoris]
MDAVQELIENVRQAQVDGSSRAVPLVSATAATRRTKMVFVYSDEDEDDVHRGADDAARGTAVMPCENHAIPLSEDALAELRADAHAIDAPLHALSDGANEEDADGMGNLFFQEDVLSGLGAAASAPGLTSTLMHSLSSASSGRMHVREVDAPALWDGAVASANTAADGASEANAAAEMPALLRRGLPASTFVLRSRRKRFRDPDGEVASTAQPFSSAPAAATQVSSSVGEPVVFSTGGATEAEESEAVLEELDVLPVYDEDGKTVRALQTRGGYQLTLDERDLLENADEADEEDAVDGAADSAADDAAVEPYGEDSAEAVEDNVVERQEGPDADASDVLAAPAAEEWGDLFDDSSDNEDEEEEEIDEAIVVAVAEQLMRCCEADDLDSQMSCEATRFVAAAKPLLKDLTEEAITPKEFGQKIDRDLRRFQRVYRSVYRPRDSPIVIDGVVMDM